MAQVFSCRFCEMFKNTFFTEHLRMILLSICGKVDHDLFLFFIYLFIYFHVTFKCLENPRSTSKFRQKYFNIDFLRYHLWQRTFSWSRRSFESPVKDCRKISLLILSKFKQINELLFPLKLSESHIGGNRSKLIHLNTLNVRNKIRGRSLRKNVPFWSYSGPHFLAFGLNTERYGISLCIQSE